MQDRQVCRAFEIKHPPGLLRLVVLFETDLPERLEHLASLIIDAVRLAYEGYD